MRFESSFSVASDGFVVGFAHRCLSAVENQANSDFMHSYPLLLIQLLELVGDDVRRVVG